MSSREQIERLHHLLHRVQVRAAEPRTAGAAYVPAAAAAMAAPEAAAPSYPTPTPEPLEVDHGTVPPPTPIAYAEPAYVSSDDDADVEVSSETVEVDIDIDEPMPMESGAQPVAQQTMPPDDLEEEVEEAPLTTQPPQTPIPDEEVTQAAPANEIEEPAPSSSRRPIAAEEVAETYGEESAPRHTPPPESGKQVAAPSVHPVATPVKQTAPPPAPEANTLHGGWREPGLGPQAPPPPTRTATPPMGQLAIPAQPSGTRLAPDVTRPEVFASANVAKFDGPAPVAKPTTMGELLDMTLSL